MQDLRNKIDNGECSVCLKAQNGETVSADGHTILPLITLAEQHRDLFRGALVADKVIGKGAASVLVSLDVAAVYGRLMSRSGKQMLEQNGIIVFYSTLVDTIFNNRRDGMCPLETAVAEIKGADECCKAVFAFAEALREKMAK